MGTEGGSTAGSGADPWATEMVATLSMLRLAWKVLLGAAAVALALGVLYAYTVTWGFPRSGSPFEGSGMNSVGQFAGAVMNSLLPAGLLFAAGVALRLQAARFETDLMDDDPDPAERSSTAG